MTLEISCKLDKEDKEYTFLEKGHVSISVKNLTDNCIQVFTSFISFKKPRLEFQKKCDVVIEPNNVKCLPSIEFTINLGASDWSNFFSTGIRYRTVNGKRSREKKSISLTDDYLKVQPYPPRNVKVFISHSNSEIDNPTTSKLDKLLRNAGFTPYIAERDPQPGHSLWGKICKEIKISKYLFVLCTKDGAKSCDVREEIGIAVGLEKTDKIIPIVEKDVFAPGSLSGLEHIPLDRGNVDKGLIEAIDCLVSILEKPSDFD